MLSITKRHSVLPGFGLTMGYTMLYLSLIVLIPLSALFAKSATLTFAQFVEVVTDRRVLDSYLITFGTALLGAAINAGFGFIVAWTLVRYRFPGRKFVDALVDLPFALPTAVSGIALATLYAPSGWLVRWLDPLLKPMHTTAAYSPIGVTIAMTFIGLPFVVRTLQPALEDLDLEVEEAAGSLGATRLQTFGRVIFPAIFPALLTGFALAFARAVGEYGSVIFIAGNMPRQGGHWFSTEITSLLIVAKLEDRKYAEATAIAVVMLLASFALLLLINLLQWWMRRHREAA